MDQELRDLLRNIGFTIVIILIFSIVFILVLLRFGASESSIIEKIKKKQDMVILVQKNKCDNCREIKKVLRENTVYYDVLNTTTEKQYSTILKVMGIEKSDIVEPSIVLIKEGVVDSILVDIQKMDDLKDFIEYNNLSN